MNGFPRKIKRKRVTELSLILGVRKADRKLEFGGLGMGCSACLASAGSRVRLPVPTKKRVACNPRHLPSSGSEKGQGLRTAPSAPSSPRATRATRPRQPTKSLRGTWAAAGRPRPPSSGPWRQPTSAARSRPAARRRRKAGRPRAWSPGSRLRSRLPFTFKRRRALFSLSPAPCPARVLPCSAADQGASWTPGSSR